MSSFDSNSQYDLVSEAKKLTNNDLCIIPVKDKKLIIKWESRKKQLATPKEIDFWFGNGNSKISRANGIGIAINNTEFGIDIDGEKCEFIFKSKIISKLSTELQNKINNTMTTKSPRGHHRTFRIIIDDFKDGIKDKKVIDFDGHNEITIMGKNYYFVERGSNYEIVKDVDCISTLSKNEASELLNIDNFKAESNGIKTVLGVLKKHYNQPKRDKIVFALSGFLHKNGVPEYLIHDIIEQLASEANDDEISSRLRVVEDTCSKDADSDHVSGYKVFLEALDNDGNAIDEIIQVFNQLQKISNFKFKFRTSNSEDGVGDGKESDELEGINNNIRAELGTHVYAKISSSPPRLYVAHNRLKRVIKK